MVHLHRLLFTFAPLFFTVTPALAIQPQQGWLAEASYLDGHMDIGEAYLLSGPNTGENYDLVQVGAGVGYAFRTGFITELKIHTSALEIWSDIFGLESYKLTEIHLAASYDLYLADRFSIGPEIRFTKAMLDTKESALFNPGPEEEYSFDEYAWTWGAKAKLRVSEVFTMALSHYRGDYDFGDTQITGLEFQWHWH